MLPLRLMLCSLVLLASASAASAQDDPGARAAAGAFPQGFDQTVYKGLVGKVLDGIPMDPLQRVGLQRTNAVVSNTMFGRSLAAWVGLSNPVLLLGGLVWGMWAAANILPAEAETELAADPVQSASAAAAQARLRPLLAPAAAVEDAVAPGVAVPVLLRLLTAGNPDAAALRPSQVIKIWLPQRSSMRP